MLNYTVKSEFRHKVQCTYLGLLKSHLGKQKGEKKREIAFIHSSWADWRNEAESLRKVPKEKFVATSWRSDFWEKLGREIKAWKTAEGTIRTSFNVVSCTQFKRNFWANFFFEKKISTAHMESVQYSVRLYNTFSASSGHINWGKVGTVFKEFWAEEISCILLFCVVCKCIFLELER